MLIVYDDALERHLAGINHPEQPDRVRVAAAELSQRGMLDELVPTRAATIMELARCHSLRYIEKVELECKRLEPDTWSTLSTGDVEIDASSFDVALHAAGGTLVALEAACAGRRGTFSLVRPPGHHAGPSRGMGFCLFNNAAIAARTFTLGTGRPALIADIDYHHGNGTQAMVDGALSYVSTHASPAYPGTGDPSENRSGAGGTLLNVPIDAHDGIATEAFVALWTTTLRQLVAQLRPGIVIVSAGYDFVSGDPVGDLGVAPSAARQLGRVVREVVETYCEGRAVFVLEGGYEPQLLASCVADTIAGFEEGRTVDDADPASIPPALEAIVDEVVRS